MLHIEKNYLLNVQSKQACSMTYRSYIIVFIQQLPTFHIYNCTLFKKVFLQKKVTAKFTKRKNDDL